ncbi:SDR family NAD(P)-dependent oxidoreductase [Leifsonia poae]|uniref:SDR family NAD(P)-dependent oxidoreductase n=1 Tax=Leifsonia poae TaxID=110933 RepID=UPI003D675B55
MNTSPAWVITGPTSGIGLRTALELAKHGTVVLVGRDPKKLAEVQAEIRSIGSDAVTVIADFSDVDSVRHAAAEIVALDLSIGGVLNNAGIMPSTASKTVAGFDLTFATDHLGPFAFTEALIPNLADGTTVTFIVSAVEDADRKIAHRAGYRGSRYISAEASARGEWMPGGSTHGGYDAYATSKQGGLATVLSFAREFPRLRFRAIEPGVNPGSNLSRDASPAAQRLAKILGPVLSPLPYFSTPKRAARMIAGVVTDTSDATGVYYNENGRPMTASAQVSDPAFQDRYVAETRELLADR